MWKDVCYQVMIYMGLWWPFNFVSNYYVKKILYPLFAPTIMSEMRTLDFLTLQGNLVYSVSTIHC